MADEATLRKCAVCDVKTTSACGGCGLPFCSREHQKLLWKTHKWLCGKDPSKFTFPPLSPTELAAYTQLYEAHMASPEPCKAAESCIYTNNKLCTSPEEWPRVLDDLASSACSVPEPTRSRLLVLLHIHTLRCGEVIFRRTPWHWMALTCLLKPSEHLRMLPECEEADTFLVPLFHQLLNYFTVAYMPRHTNEGKEHRRIAMARCFELANKESETARRLIMQDRLQQINEALQR
ncbi:hypothetical protein JCM10213v2_006342 [Rhodosporidiobolus nylandii]